LRVNYVGIGAVEAELEGGGPAVYGKDGAGHE
jgi:hypothetical protein